MRRVAAVAVLLASCAVPLPPRSAPPARLASAQPVTVAVTASRLAGPVVARQVPPRAPRPVLSPSPRASRRATRGRTAVVTAYCLRGVMADGRHVFDGAVAARDRAVPLGTRVRISGRPYVVADRMARTATAAWDVWMPSCADARTWGRRTVAVEVVR